MPAENGISYLIYTRKENVNQIFSIQLDFQIKVPQIYQHAKTQGILFSQVLLILENKLLTPKIFGETFST